jgi:hypothetical protein
VEVPPDGPPRDVDLRRRHDLHRLRHLRHIRTAVALAVAEEQTAYSTARCRRAMNRGRVLTSFAQVQRAAIPTVTYL